MITFMTGKGEVKEGKIVYQYIAYEGGMRYVVECEGRQYRCTKKGDTYIELII